MQNSPLSVVAANSYAQYGSFNYPFLYTFAALYGVYLSPDCRRLLKNAESIVDVNIIEDPSYHIATDKV